MMVEVMASPASPRRLTDEAVRETAERYNLDLSVLRAFIEVEGRPDGFLVSGRPWVHFLREHFWRRLSMRDIDPLPLCHASPDLCYPKSDGAPAQGDAEYGRLTRAIDFGAQRGLEGAYRKAAFEASCWGRFGTMGCHFAGCGYEDVIEMVYAHRREEAAHLTAILRRMQGDGLLEKLRKRRWVAFATAYNGPEKALMYSSRLRAVYHRLRQER